MVTTVGDEEQGNLIARELIARRQAASVNMIQGVKSFYRWRGKICRDGEYLLVIKTMADEYSDATATIQELHDYELPEILAFEISKGEPGFLNWIAQSVDKTAPFDEDEDLEFVGMGES